MPQTFREYPVVEVAVSVEDRNPINGNERSIAGDIIAVREPNKGIGTAEASRHLWLRIEGPDKSVLDRLQDEITSETEFTDGPRFDKRQFCIPLGRLPNVDLARVRDVDDIYQPFLSVDEDNLLFLETAERRSLRVEGLVFDKQTGRYL